MEKFKLQLNILNCSSNCLFLNVLKGKTCIKNIKILKYIKQNAEQRQLLHFIKGIGHPKI